MHMVIGIDEVGRGAWAGPLVVGAVALAKPVAGLADSKILSSQTRSRLAKEIKGAAAFYGIGWVSSSEVDDLGLTKATTLACQRAISGAPSHSKIIIDGHINYLEELSNVTTVIDGDQLVPEISAAAIIAKVARDEFMAKQAHKYPFYGFVSNVGYGTSAHLLAIKSHGLTPLHRWSFKPIQKILNNYEA